MALDDKSKKALEIADEGLRFVLEKVLENPRTRASTGQVIDIVHKGKDNEDHHVVALYSSNKYAQFQGEYTQTAWSNPELKPMIDYLLQNGWDLNID